MWKDSWWLAKKEIKYQLSAFISTILAAIVIGMLAVSGLYGLVNEDFVIMFVNENYISHLPLDIIFIGITPSFAALFMAKPYLTFRTIKEDPFSKRMAVYRALPISVDVLTRSRILMMLVNLVVLSLAFYLTMIISLPASFFQQISVSELVIFILIWFGYALALGGFNTYVEFGTNGMILYLFPLVLLLLFIMIIAFFYNYVEMGIVQWTFTIAEKYGVLAALVSMIIGVLGCLLASKLLKNRLLKRDYV